MSGHEKEALYAMIVEGSQDGIVFADAEGIVRIWNSGAARIFGHSKEEAIGKSLNLIIPEPMRERHWEGYRKVMASGETKYGTSVLAVPGVTKEGERISLEFTVILMKDDRGGTIGTAAIMRDVTSRWKSEREMKKRLAELEEMVKDMGHS